MSDFVTAEPQLNELLKGGQVFDLLDVVELELQYVQVLEPLEILKLADFVMAEVDPL